MPKIFPKRKNGHAKDDVEAHPTSSHHSGDGYSDMGEYPALDRYISTYREDTGLESQGNARDRGTSRKWWQFWKGPGEDNQRPPDRAGEVPDTWLTTDIKDGLSQSTAGERRKMVGWNELTTEKKNIFLKLVTYFMGPILYGNLP